MGALSLLIAGKILDFSWAAVCDPVKQYVGEFFEDKSPGASTPRNRLLRSNGVAVGLAIGYFHNFLKPLDEALTNGQLLIFAHEIKTQKNSLVFSPEQMAALGPEGVRQMSESKIETYANVGSFAAEQFQLVIVCPMTLDAQNFNRVNDYLSQKTRKGAYYSLANSRSYGINYNSPSANAQIVIEDYVRPVEAMGKYYRTDKKLSDEQMAEIQQEEIELFLATMYRLCQNHTRHLFAKTKFLAVP